MRNTAYHYYLQLLILIASISSNVTLPTEIKNETHSKWLHFTSETPRLTRKTFPCGKPQSRSYALPGLMKSVQQNSGEIVNFPFYTVLKRCDEHSGCCMTADKSCAPVVSKNYYVYIQIQIESLKTNTTRKEWVEVEQHGECTCISIEEQRYLENKRPKIKILSVEDVALIRQREKNGSSE